LTVAEVMQQDELAYAERLLQLPSGHQLLPDLDLAEGSKDDPQSRYINERAHANIQKDGTFSVIPRMWGGETNSIELRRIADVVDKFKIPTVKVTGGQRIDLLGVKKEDLREVWHDLGMPSGLAYAKGLRTVKTCVGSEWCRFGTQDSTKMGQQLEHQLARMYAPHKVKAGGFRLPA
jgi:nitrite reductase (NADH) large subunit